MPRNLPIPPDLKSNPIWSQIWSNVYFYNMNQIFLVVGLPRTGKSELCLDCGWVLERNYKYEHTFTVNNLFPTLKEMVNATMSKNRRGECLVWEEAGTIKGATAREFKQRKNIISNSLFQILGWKGQIAFINLPAQFYLDKGIRSLAHGIFVTKKIDLKRNRCIAKFYWNKFNPLNSTRPIMPTLPRYFKDGRLRVARTIAIPRAPKELREEYVAKQEEFKQKWSEEIGKELEELDAVNEGKDARKLDVASLYEEVKQNPDEYWDYEKNKPDTNSMIVAGISRHIALAIAGKWKKDIARGLVSV